MADLPEILAGPILRRCTEAMVTVWLATSVDLKDGLELALYDASNVKAPKPIEVTTDHQVVKAGANLFIHLIVARPKAASGPKAPTFPRGKLLGYEVRVLSNAVPETSPLHSVPLGEFLPTVTLDYGTYPWPTFFLQATGTALRLLHGSCRRAYAPGLDAMAAPDSIIKETLADLTKRPALMLLTGDQIYADDILWSMWSHTSHLAQKVMGYDEAAPVDGKLKPLSTIDGRRDLILKAGITTDDGENHLIGFSEYAAHYLLNWSETLWDGYKAQIVPKSGMTPKEFLEQSLGLERVDQFQVTLPAVRRGLANIPTYMIFDDHDVTDDWNLDQQWQKETEASPLGTRLITCAMYAYWLFQAWGNDPDTFNAKFVAQIQSFCDLFARNAGAPSAADTSDFDTFIHTAIRPASGFGGHPSWTYVVPCTPPIFVLDTRTSRDLQPRGGGPGLINREGQDGLRHTIDVARRDGALDLSTMPLVMVSATPYWPEQFIDVVQRSNIVSGSKNSLSADLEFWRNNLRAHTNFMLLIMRSYRPSSIVFLSGDVHYAFTGHTTLYSGSVDPQTDADGKRKTGGKFVDIYQLTSSGFKNENSNAKLSRHTYSKTATSLLFNATIQNDWVNYLFENQGDVSLNGKRFMDALMQTHELDSYMLPEIYLMNIANLHGGPLLMPDYLFKILTLKVNHPPEWREEVQLYDHRGSSGAYITTDANVGLVTFDGQSLTHELYGLDGDARLSRLAPKTWGPAGVPLRLGR